MRLLLAVDSITTLDILLDEMMNRSWRWATSVANRAHCSVRVIRRQDVSRNEESLLRRASPSARSMGTVYRFEESLGWKKAA